MYQLIGRKSCSETRKTERFLKERKMDFQFVDLDKRDLSPGELNNIFNSVPPDSLIDKKSRHYSKRGLEFMDYDPAQEILEDQKLIITPILRIKNRVLTRAAGSALDESVLKNFLQS